MCNFSNMVGRPNGEIGIERGQKIKDNKWCLFGKYNCFPDYFTPAPKHRLCLFFSWMVPINVEQQFLIIHQPLELDANTEKRIRCFRWIWAELYASTFSILSEKAERGITQWKGRQMLKFLVPLYFGLSNLDHEPNCFLEIFESIICLPRCVCWNTWLCVVLQKEIHIPQSNTTSLVFLCTN